jgi:hypothetical protein
MDAEVTVGLAPVEAEALPYSCRVVLLVTGDLNGFSGKWTLGYTDDFSRPNSGLLALPRRLQEEWMFEIIYRMISELLHSDSEKNNNLKTDHLKEITEFF